MNRILKSILSTSQGKLSEKHAKLIYLIYQMYQQGVKKFSNNTNLKINYAYFLLDKLKYRQQALQELNNAEEYSPPFDVQFTIFRMKKIIEEEI